MSNRKSPRKNKYRTAIIGAGRIGATFDAPQSQDTLTHAHGYTDHPLTELIGFFDSDASRSEVAARRWSSKSFSSINALLEQGKPDIVSVCTPDETHALVLERLLEYGPKLIICEKPVTTKSQDTEKIIRLAVEKKVPVLVNYSRRFDSTIEELRRSMSEGRYGKVLVASGIYVRGTLHNGSHLIDLARCLFGGVKRVVPLFARDDFSATDKSIAAFLEFENCPQFQLSVGDGRHYFVSEFDILFEKARWHFTDKGFKYSVQTIAVDPTFPDFIKSPKPAPETPTGLGKAIVRLIDNAVAHLNSGAPLLCGLEDALETQRVCEQLLRA